MSPRTATTRLPARRRASRRRLAALVLAAGYSSRMHRFKPLLGFGGSTVIEHAVRTFQGAGIRDVVVVTGYRCGRLAPVLDRLGVRRVVNADYDQGMYSSVRAGVRALGPEVEACFVLPADMPAVRCRTVLLLAAELARTGAHVVYPSFRGLRGHPPLVARALFPAVLAGDGAGGLRAVLERAGRRARVVAVLDEGVTVDLDTPADYRAARETFGDRSVPTDAECAALFAELELDPRIVRHGRTVADVAARLASALAAGGWPVDVALVRASALVHDLCKGRPDHARAGAKLLCRLGFDRLAPVVAAHMDLPPRAVRLDETALVYLADKLVKGEQLVPLGERCAAALERFGHSRAARAACSRRFARAREVAILVEAALGGDAFGIASLTGRPT